MRTWDSEGRPRTTRALSLRSAEVLPQKTPCLRGFFLFFDGAWLTKGAVFGQAARKQLPVHRIHGLLEALRRPVFFQCGLVIPCACPSRSVEMLYAVGKEKPKTTEETSMLANGIQWTGKQFCERPSPLLVGTLSFFHVVAIVGQALFENGV